MTITKEVQGQLFSAETNRLICLPSRPVYAPIAATAGSVVTTSPVGSSGNGNNGTPWTEDEHARFLHGLELFPSGPWRSIANVVGTRTARQTMSHAQKYRQKIARRQRGPRVVEPEPPVATNLMTESDVEFHLTSEQIDEIILSLFDSDDEEVELTSEELEVLRGHQ